MLVVVEDWRVAEPKAQCGLKTPPALPGTTRYQVHQVCALYLFGGKASLQVKGCFVVDKFQIIFTSCYQVLPSTTGY